jgi:hypothetical protein
MKRMSLGVLVVVAAAMLAPVSSQAVVRVRVVHRGPRTRVVVHRGFPLRRALPRAVVVAPRVAIRVAPLRYLAPVVWAPVVVVAPARTELAWEDSQDLAHGDGWLDFTLNADSRGRKLFLGVDGGRVQLNFAEVVFANGDTQVVDFGERTRAPGLYSLLDFADGRKVDHVRMVARATSESASVSLRLLK